MNNSERMAKYEELRTLTVKSLQLARELLSETRRQFTNEKSELGEVLYCLNEIDGTADAYIRGYRDLVALHFEPVAHSEFSEKAAELRDERIADVHPFTD